MDKYDPETFDPCGIEGSSGGCATCPMATECIPASLLADLEEYFRDPLEPEGAVLTTVTPRSFA